MDTKDSPAVDQLSVEELAAKLEPDLLPKHVAIIMDGNGRWAETRSLPRIDYGLLGIGDPSPDTLRILPRELEPPPSRNLFAHGLARILSLN
jgi:hypothetical protein